MLTSEDLRVADWNLRFQPVTPVILKAMGFGESIVLVFAFGGTLASILGVFYTIASRRSGRETRAFIKETQALIKEIHEETRALIKETHAQTQTLIKETHKETQGLIERIDERRGD